MQLISSDAEIDNFCGFNVAMSFLPPVYFATTFPKIFSTGCVQWVFYLPICFQRMISSTLQLLLSFTPPPRVAPLVLSEPWHWQPPLILTPPPPLYRFLIFFSKCNNRFLVFCAPICTFLRQKLRDLQPLNLNYVFWFL